jgi:hypothetical protein
MDIHKSTLLGCPLGHPMDVTGEILFCTQVSMLLCCVLYLYSSIWPTCLRAYYVSKDIIRNKCSTCITILSLCKISNNSHLKNANNILVMCPTAHFRAILLMKNVF